MAYAVFVMLHLVAQPANLITQFSDGHFKRLGIINQQTRILPNLWQRVYLPLHIAHSFHHSAKALAHFFQKHARIVGAIVFVGHTTSLALILLQSHLHATAEA